MARRTVTTEVEVEVELGDYSTDDLVEELEFRGALDAREDLADVIRRRHDEQHAGLLCVCTDEVCDAYERSER